MLNFIGRGSAFNTKEGNNSAFIKDGSKIILFDCGSDTFSTIQELNLLEGIDEIHAVISHTHPDHIGSLGDLIFYGYYVLKKEQPAVTIYTHKSHELPSLLKLMGVSGEKYNLEYMKIDIGETINLSKDNDIIIIPVKASHTKNLFCLSFIIDYKGETAFYSADSNKLDREALDALEDELVDYYYQDTSWLDYEGNVHLSYKKLVDAIPKEYRSKFYCMHLDQTFDEEQAIKDGFNVVQRYNPTN